MSQTSEEARELLREAKDLAPTAQPDFEAAQGCLMKLCGAWGHGLSESDREDAARLAGKLLDGCWPQVGSVLSGASSDPARLDQICEMLSVLQYIFDESKGPEQIDRIADLLWENATDPLALGAAYVSKISEEVLWCHNTTGPEAKAADKLQALAVFDRELTERFGGEAYVFGAHSGLQSVGLSLLRVISGKAKADQTDLNNFRREKSGYLLGRTGIFKSKYTKAYVTYLNGRLNAATDKIPKAISLYEKSLNLGFNPHKCFQQLVCCLEHRNNKAKMLKLLQEWIPRFGFNPASPDFQESEMGRLFAEMGGDFASLPKLEEMDFILKQAQKNQAKINKLA